MPTRARRLGCYVLLTLTGAGLSACGSEAPDAADGAEPIARSEQAFAACVSSVEGVGDIGVGWIGLQSDGTLWRGAPAQKYAGLDQIATLGDIDGEALTWCVTRTDNTAWCWGANNAGQVGNGDLIEQANPVQITALGNQVKQVVTSNDFGCALKFDNTVWCWGDNEAAQLGTGDTTSSLVPVQVAGLGNTVEKISAGFLHTCAKKTDDTLWCWGNNTFGEIGKGNFNSPQLTPIQVMSDVDKFSAGGFFTCAIDNSQKLFCWGDNADGHVGVGDQSNHPSPQELTSLGSVAAVDASVRAACAIKADSTVWCWGWQDHGRLGDGVNADAPVTLPKRVSGSLGTTGGAKSIHTTDGGACVVTTGNELMCWGGGGFLDGQGQSSVPVAVDFCSLPRLNSISPATGSTLGGTQVNFNGDGLSASTRVFFDDTEATAVSYVSPTQVRATAPPFYQAIVDVRIENPGGKIGVLPDAFSYLPPPAVYSAAPSAGPLAGGTSITLLGSALQSGVTISVGGTPATGVSFVSASEVRAVTPAHPAGFVNIVVTNPDGQTGQLNDAFQFKAAPATMSIAPTSGVAGVQVVLTGTGYEWNSVVRVDSAVVSATYVDDTTLGINMPAHAAGVASIEVENADGQKSTLADAFTYTTGSGGAGGSAGAGATAGSGADGGSDPGGASAGGSAGAAGDAATGGSAGTEDRGGVKCFCSTPGSRGAGDNSGSGANYLLPLLAGLVLRRRRP